MDPDCLPIHGRSVHIFFSLIHSYCKIEILTIIEQNLISPLGSNGINIFLASIYE